MQEAMLAECPAKNLQTHIGKGTLFTDSQALLRNTHDQSTCDSFFLTTVTINGDKPLKLPVSASDTANLCCGENGSNLSTHVCHGGNRNRLPPDVFP